MKKKSVNRKAGKPKTWLVTGLLAAAAVAYVVFVFLPLQHSMNKLRQQVQERRQQIMQAQSLVGTVAQTRLRLAAAREVSQQWRAAAPRPAQIITHYASLTQQAEEAGVAIDRLDPLPAVELSLIAQQNVAMQFHGPFSAVFDLLHRLEALPGTLWVRDLRMQAITDNDNTLKGELTLTIFVDRTDYAN
jgi:Tfp pilus assembly protein PilO